MTKKNNNGKRKELTEYSRGYLTDQRMEAEVGIEPAYTELQSAA